MGYHHLADRTWPGTKRSNIDLLLVGPSGVYVIDTKCWSDVSVQSGRLYRGDADAQDEVDKLLRVDGAGGSIRGRGRTAAARGAPGYGFRRA